MKSFGIYSFSRCDYKPLPNRYSEDAQRLVADLLSMDPGRRPSAKQLLMKPFIGSFIKSLFSEQDVQVTRFSKLHAEERGITGVEGYP